MAIRQKNFGFQKPQLHHRFPLHGFQNNQSQVTIWRTNQFPPTGDNHFLGFLHYDAAARKSHREYFLQLSEVYPQMFPIDGKPKLLQSTLVEALDDTDPDR